METMNPHGIRRPTPIPRKVETVVSVDLGKRLCGVAAWTLGGVLLRADTVEGGPGPLSMATAVRFWALWGADGAVTVPGFVIELPQNYRDFRVAHRDLDTLRAVGSDLDPFAAYTPHAWKGSVPKDVHRGRLLGALGPSERGGMEGWDHNAWDAVGIGLYFFGRTDRGGTPPALRGTP